MQDKSEGMWCDFCGKHHTGQCKKEISNRDNIQRKFWELWNYAEKQRLYLKELLTEKAK